MKKLLKIILKTGVAFAIIIFLTILSSLFSSTNADESIVCCNPGASLLDPCIYNLGPPPVFGACRSWETPVEWGACGYTNQLICDDHYHPGDYSCQCSGPDPLGQYDCNYISNDCNFGFRPSCSNCGPNIYTPGCPVGSICQLTCIEGNPGGAGSPCLCNYDCQGGLYCGPTGVCQLTALPTPTITPGGPTLTPVMPTPTLGSGPINTPTPLPPGLPCANYCPPNHPNFQYYTLIECTSTGSTGDCVYSGYSCDFDPTFACNCCRTFRQPTTPPSECSFTFPGTNITLPGSCYFLAACPPGTTWAGSNSPLDNGCPFGYSCCVDSNIYTANQIV